MNMSRDLSSTLKYEVFITSGSAETCDDECGRFLIPYVQCGYYDAPLIALIIL
jgi:hypothetical protein